jgi:TPR repeat protein
MRTTPMAKKRKMPSETTRDLLAYASWAEEKGDIELAIYYLKKAVRSGSNDARSMLGAIYDDVLKPPKPDRAAYWYKQALRNGDTDCAWNLAMHFAGLGKKRGYSHWLRVANELGDEDAPEEIQTGEWWSKRTKDIARNKENTGT